MNERYTKEKIQKLISQAPKPQLHLHLDGSLSYTFITAALKRLKARNKNVVVFENNWEPSNEDELINWFRNRKKSEQEKGWKVGSSKNWNIFTICNYFLQTKLDLFEATYDLVTRIAQEHNVNYIELRFAPVLHTNEGLTERETVVAVLDGFKKAKIDLTNKSLFVSGGIILCGLRSFPVSAAMETVQLIQSLNDDRILGFDIAGDEVSYPLKLFEDVIGYSVESKIKTTVHAGEWNASSKPFVVENLRLAVSLGVNRIGHGLALGSLDNDDDIFVMMKAKNVSVEVCLTGNCSHPDKCASFREHPLSKFILNGIKIAALNVDNLLLSGNDVVGCPDPSGEYIRAIYDCGINPDQLLEIIGGGYRAAFTNLSESFIEDNLKAWKDHVIPYL